MGKPSLRQGLLHTGARPDWVCEVAVRLGDPEVWIAALDALQSDRINAPAEDSE